MAKRRGLLIFLFALIITFWTMTGMRMTAKAEDGNYLTFTGSSSFSINTRNTSKNWNGTLEYSTDASSWSVWNGTSIDSGANNKLYLRGTGNTKIAGSYDKEWQIASSGTVSCSGDIRTLLNYSDPANSSMANECFSCMFYHCDKLVSAPDLPATTLTRLCYQGMFIGCTRLKVAPKLPATTLADRCYENMFVECTNLTVAPELPATTLTTACYGYMFYGCTNLTVAPKLPATTLANYCYHEMFSYCTSLIVPPELPATTLPDDCYSQMFDGCTNMKISENPGGIYKSEYRIPKSGNGTDAISSCDSMFFNTGGAFTGTPNINTTYYIAGYSIALAGGNNATASGGAADQMVVREPMAEVIYTADTNYCFAKFDDITKNGITVKWISDTKISVSGKPTAHISLQIPDAQKIKCTVTYKVVNGTWSDGTAADKTEAVEIGSKPVSIPTGMIAASGCLEGAWDKNPEEATITEATTFTYTFSTNGSYNTGFKITQKKGKIKISWDKVEGVTKCEVFVSYCGSNFSKKPTKTTKSNSVTIKKIKGKKIDFTKNIKFYVKGYNRSGKLVGESISAHFAGIDSKNGKNPKEVKLSTKSLTLDKGKSAKIKASVKMEEGKKKAMSESHVAKLRYRTGNANVATVDKKGKVTAVNPGTCTIYVYAKNGLAKKVAVTVN